MQEWWKYEERDVTIFTRSCKPFLRSSCLAWQQTSSLVFCALNQSIKKMCTHINITEETPDLEKGGVELTAKLLKSKLQFLFCAFYILITKSRSAPDCTQSFTGGRAPVFSCYLILSDIQGMKVMVSKGQIGVRSQRCCKGLILTDNKVAWVNPRADRNSDHYE